MVDSCNTCFLLRIASAILVALVATAHAQTCPVTDFTAVGPYTSSPEECSDCSWYLETRYYDCDRFCEDNGLQCSKAYVIGSGQTFSGCSALASSGTEISCSITGDNKARYSRVCTCEPHPLTVPSPHCIKVFKGVNYGGDMQEICDNTPGLTNEWSQNIRSITLGSKVVSATLFDLPDYLPGVLGANGTVVNVNGNTANIGNLNSNIVGRVESIYLTWKPAPGSLPPNDCVWLYNHTGYNGKLIEICVGHDLWDLPKQNFGGSSSVKFGIQVTQVKLFDGTAFSGASKTFTSSDSSFVADGWNDRAKSIKVTA